MPTPSLVQSHLRYPLTRILGSAGNVRILRALATDGALQSAPRLAQIAGLTPQGARLVLENLARQQVVATHGSGRAQLFSLNAPHPFAATLTGLFAEELRRWDALLAAIREVLEQHRPALAAAWLYGSVARGDDATDSDLDIAVLVRSHGVTDKIRQALKQIEDSQQIRVSLTGLTPKELASLADDDPWWTNVQRDGRVLAGVAPEQTKRRLATTAA
jgi:predicted nucleotidyltransferase